MGIYNMRPQSIDDATVLSSLERTFRTHGYEGTSLTLLSQATGLERASLYHRFPGGKLEMAIAVASNVVDKFKQNVFDVIESDLAVDAKTEKVKRFLTVFYENGSLSCLLNTFSLTCADEGLRSHLESALGAWIDSFTHLAILFGCSKERAPEQAVKAIVNIQGALVVSRVLRTDKPFLDSLELLQPLLKG